MTLIITTLIKIEFNFYGIHIFNINFTFYYRYTIFINIINTFEKYE